jgi:hypothetical protein
MRLAMKTIALTLAAAVLVACAQAQAPRQAAPLQQLTTTCRYEAETRGLGANDKERFIATCLADGRRREQEVLTECRLESRSKPALERRAFMDECYRR